ncbi:MAG TPA: cyclic nucleotide-binding domain-containing protein [Anaerolineae bacterium]|nr:cyclic nucleotide-binding domain-containing protein [Anaerolineae bacterium]
MSNTQEIIAVLNKTPLFQSLKQRQLESLATRFVEREFATGDAIVTQGKGGVGLFIIVSGKAQAIRTHVDGSQTVLNPLGPTDFFGELALLTDATRTASVVATEPTNCLVLTQWDFLGILRQDADMAVTILQELAGRFSHVMSMM